MKKVTSEITEIFTELPYCLNKIDTRFFKIGDRKNTKIRFVKEKSLSNRRPVEIESENLESIRDKWGVDFYSKVHIITEKEFSSIDDVKKFTLNCLNKIIRLYRYYDEDAIHLVYVNNDDLLNLTYKDKNSNSFNAVMDVGLSINDPIRNYHISNKIEETILKNLDVCFWEELLIGARRYLYQHDYRHTILESVIALEYVVFYFIKKKCEEDSVSVNFINSFSKDIGISNSVNVLIKLLSDKKDLPPEIVFQKCRTSIKIRNKIVHEGRDNITLEQAQDAHDYCKRLIDFLSPYLYD